MHRVSLGYPIPDLILIRITLARELTIGDKEAHIGRLEELIGRFHDDSKILIGSERSSRRACTNVRDRQWNGDGLLCLRLFGKDTHKSKSEKESA